MISISASEQELVRKTVYETLTKLGITQDILLAKFNFSIKWSNRFIRTMGMAKFTPFLGDTYEAIITFSVKLWHIASPEERRVTVIHEVCHIVANFRAVQRYILYPAAHGYVWKSLMIKVGISNPQKYHNVNYLKPKDIEGRCKCRTHSISPRKIEEFKRTSCRYVCSACHTYIKF